MMAFVIAICGGEAMKLRKNFADAGYNGANVQNSLSAGESKTTQIELGQYISLGKYNGKDVIWRCVSVDDKGSLMLADKVIDTLPYDAKTNDNNRSKSHSRNYKRDTYGSNYWKDSNMRSWLNSAADAGEVKWLCGNPPRAGYVKGNAYDQKAGFLNDFSKAEIAAMKNMTQRSLVSHPEYNLGFHDGEGRSDLELNYDIENVDSNFDSAYGENSTEKVFLPDVQQVNTVWKNFGNYYIARNEQGVAWPYWLRTPVTDCNHDMRYVHSNGSVDREWPNTDYIGVRPAFYLDSDYYVTTSGDGSASNPYVGSAPDKVEDDYTVAEPEDDPNQEWDVSLDQQLRLTLGPYYSSDGKYANPTIPVYTIQKTRSDTENMVILICGEGYTKSQQQKFINDVKKVWEGAMQYEPYRSYADRFNVYALCTASESNFNSGGSTFFDVVIDKKSGPMISVNKSAWKNHIFERCIGPTFLEQIHDAHIPNKTDPDTFIWDDDKMYPPFYYVHKYINQFAVLVNTTQDFGGSHRNYKRGIHYLITPADSPRAQKTFTHELGHGLLELGDEYMTTAAESTDYTSLNVAYTHDPEKVKWKQMLGFRKTFTCNTSPSYTAYNSSWECLMRDTTYQFCEVCKLQGSKRMSQLIDGKSLYVADPEVKKYTGQYSAYSDFVNTTYTGYYNFANYRNGVLLSGADKNKFNADMVGKKIELRTIVQNLSDVTERYVTMKVWIKRADGSVGTTVGGSKLEATQTFTIPVWSEKSKFWAKGALEYKGSDFSSGLASCSLIYQIPADALLYDGDTVAFEVTDENGNVLANDNTETQTYANINIEYKFEDGTPIPTANKAIIPVAVGSYINWTAAPSLYGHTLSRVEGLNQIVSGSGQTVTYYYNYVKATIGNVTISGEQGGAIANTDITVTLAGYTFETALSGDWITNLPAGLVQTVKRISDTKAKITVSGTPTALSDQFVEITIPKANITGLASDLTVESNSDAKFNIVAPLKKVLYPKVKDIEYNGKPQSGVEEGEGYTLADHIATNAGEYKATATLESGYKWSDGYTERSRIVKWTIKKRTAKTEDFIFTPPSNLVYDNSGKRPNVKIKDEFNYTGYLDFDYKCGESVVLEPVDAGEYKVYVNVSSTENFNPVRKIHDASWKFTIANASQNMPDASRITTVAPTSSSANDGIIHGIGNDMEYRKAGDALWTQGTGSSITGLSSGNYEIRYKAKFNYDASPSITVTIPESGVISYSLTVNNGTGGGVFAEGASVTITANEPATGKKFDKWVATGITLSDVDLAKSTLTFTMPANNVTMEVTYKDLTYNVNVTGGTTTLNEAKYQENVTVTANIPEVGKEFDKWVVSGITLSNTDLTRSTLTFKMPANDVTFTATYKDIVYRVTVTDGTATLDMATYQTEVTVTANEPAADMYFDKWEVTGLDTTGMDLTKTEITFNMPAGNVTFKATYLTHIKYEILVVDGTKDKSPVMAGETVTITANPAKPGKVFDKWTCETPGVTIEFASATSAKTTFVMPAQEIEIQAHFRDEGTAPSVEIKVDGGTGAGTYTQGDTVTVTANEPAEGKVFKGWKDGSGNIVSTDKAYTFTVNGETTLTAVYEDKASGGEITPPPDKKDGLSGGAIAGIAIGTILGVGIIGFAIFWFAVKKKDVC